MTKANFLPFNFLGLDAADTDLNRAKVVILPVPFERTVSFGRGTSKGPHSIIYASRSLELYDDELGYEPCGVGIHTLCELESNVVPAEMVGN
ncbi:MAG: arginase family protein, partial [Candidatus Dadabacteria bacterium]|nr:arginase family protein [Candidatus Dadabacteria bacterium]